jgi:hypothetical protein
MLIEASEVVLLFVLIPFVVDLGPCCLGRKVEPPLVASSEVCVTDDPGTERLFELKVFAGFGLLKEELAQDVFPDFPALRSWLGLSCPT